MEILDYSVLGVNAQNRLEVAFHSPYEEVNDFQTDVDIPRKADFTVDLPALTLLLDGIARSQAESMMNEYNAIQGAEDVAEIFGSVEEDADEQLPEPTDEDADEQLPEPTDEDPEDHVEE